MAQPILRLTQDTDKHLPWVDYSTLSAVNMCPRYGIITNYLGKRFKGLGTEQRAMALEAGSAMHDMFAAVRMFELLQHSKQAGAVPDYIYNHGKRLFTNEQFPTRWEEMVQISDTADDYRTVMMRFGLYALETTGFYDDPNDRRRTQTNLETAAISYIDRYPQRRYIPYTCPNRQFVGVEIPVDFVIEADDIPPFRIVGKADGFCYDTLNSDRLEVHENKTGSRIDQAWASAFIVGHQPSTYLVGLSLMLGFPTEYATIWGTQIPIPKTSMYSDGQARLSVSRTPEQCSEWLHWVLDTWAVIRRFESDPAIATMYTHSCNRYFSSCALIPLCSDTIEQRRYVLDKEMIVKRWSPLHDEGD